MCPACVRKSVNRPLLYSLPTIAATLAMATLWGCFRRLAGVYPYLPNTRFLFAGKKEETFPRPDKSAELAILVAQAVLNTLWN